MYQFFHIENHNTGDIMISSHIIKDDAVILYLDYSFEIGSFDGKKVKDTLSNILDYLKNTKIDIDGKKIMLMLGSTLIATLIYTNGVLGVDNSTTNNAQQATEIVESIMIDDENTEQKTQDKGEQESNIIVKSEEKVENVKKEEKENKKDISINKQTSNKTSSTLSNSNVTTNTSKQSKKESVVEEKRLW